MTVKDETAIMDEVGVASQGDGPRIALLTPYTGGNYGDGAIQDAMIANMRLRFPTAEFSGISLNCDDFSKRHLAGAYPLCATGRTFYGMAGRGPMQEPPLFDGLHPRQGPGRVDRWIRRLRNALGKTPGVGLCLRKARFWSIVARKEIYHAVQGYRFLATQNLLVVSGGGQLDEEWGGPWGHPFALFKWAILARFARIPFVVVSVGACKLTSSTSRRFLSFALRIAAYRSYRDKNSREIASGLLQRAKLDPVVPDLAFSMPSAELRSSNCIRKIADGRTIFAVSPIAFAKPGSWPIEDAALYERYLRQLARVITQLLARDAFLVMVWSTYSDRKVIPEIIEHLDSDAKNRLAKQMYIPEIAGWRDLVAVLLDVDFLVASRLHSTILGFIASRPTVAISFDPKVDWVMQDLGQTGSLLHIQDFEAEDVVLALDRLDSREQSVMDQLCSYRQRSASEFTRQYDAIAGLAGHFIRT
jgi:polysaccharide pyruvyl transferase WcaK-like protein